MSVIASLYTNLVKDTTTTNLSPNEKDEFLKKVKIIDEKGSEIMYIIIKMFEIENNIKQIESKVSDKELKFDFDKFPEKLQVILDKFLTIHIKNMEEERAILNERKEYKN
jgi:hypothetical protein